MAGMFSKTTKLMPESEARCKYRAIWNTLSSGDGFVQLNEESGKCFLTLKAVPEKKEKILDILSRSVRQDTTTGTFQLV